ncbi:unnamed protein product, partial [marine sediment metagenome]
LLVLVCVSVVIACVCVLLLYRTSLDQYKERLEEAVKSEGKMVEALAELNDFDPDQTLKQLIEIQEQHKGIGTTGECTLAVLEGDEIRYLPHHRYNRHPTPGSVPFEGALDEPMRQALKGETDTMVGPDYQGTTVLAAYRPIPCLGWGSVAKIELSEIRQPFVKGAAGVLLTIGVLIGGATLLLIRLGKPVVSELERSEQQYRSLVETSSDWIWEVDRDNVFTYAGPKVKEILGYTPQQIVGKSVFEFVTPEEKQRLIRVLPKIIE